MMSIQKIKEDLKKKLSSKRYEHTMGVEYTSTCLAMRYGADIEKARLAGLLHDCAKYLSSEEKLSECERYGIPVSAYERKNPELLHAKLGACFANELYGVTDPEILSAIIWHTTGCPEIIVANKLDKLKKSQVEPALALIRETLELTEEDALVPFSAEKGEGKDTLIRLLTEKCGE